MEQQSVQKQTNFDVNVSPPGEGINTSEGRLKRSYYSLPSLATIQGYILEEQKDALRWPQSLQTYRDMALDGSVQSAVNLIIVLCNRISWKIVAPEEAPDIEKRRAAFLDRKRQMMDRPWSEYILEVLQSILIYGFGPMEKSWSVETEGEFAGARYVNDMRLISQDSVEKWIYNIRSGKLLGIRQDISLIPSDLRRRSTSNFEDIPIGKIALFRHRPYRNNPEGNSPLKQSYVSWRYKSIVEEYESIGVTKDMGGVIELGVDASVLAAAANDPNSDEAKNLQAMEQSAAALHDGSQKYIIRPISYDSLNQGKDRYTFALKGIDGGGKQYDTDKIVRRHNQIILMNFLADVLNLGSEAHGSFSLANSKTSILSLGVEDLLTNDVLNTLNHNIIQQLYRLNNWDYDPEIAARYEYGDIDDLDIAEFAKASQQLIASGGVRVTEDVESVIRKRVFGLCSMKDADTEVIETTNNSRSGDGMASGLPSGTGDAVSADDRSAANLNNI